MTRTGLVGQLLARRDARGAALGGLLLLGLAMRLHGIGESGLNPDEGGYFAVATLLDWDTFWGVLSGRESDVWGNAHPPLFYLALRALRPWAADCPLLLRLPALVFGCLVIHALYLLATRLRGPATGLWAAGLAALAPGLVVQSQLVRQYTIQVALIAYGASLLLRHLETGRARDALAASLLLCASVLTHFSSVVIVAALGAAVLVEAARQRASLARLVAAAAALAPPAVLFLALYLVQISTLEGSALETGALARLEHLLHRDVAGQWSGLVGIHHYLFGPRPGTLGLILFLAGLLAAVRGRAGAMLALTLATLAIAGALSWLRLYPLGASRHCLVLAVVLVPCAAEGARWLVARPLRQALPVAAALAVIGAFPAPLRARSGVARMQIDVETVATTAVVERHAALLASALDRNGIAILDRQTYYMLAPQIAAVPEFEAGVGRLARNGSTVLIAEAWGLETQPDAAVSGEPGHLLGFLRAAERAHPDLRLGERRDGLLLFGGANVILYRTLPELDRMLAPPRGGCVRERRVEPGFGSARIDLACWLHSGSRS